MLLNRLASYFLRLVPRRVQRLGREFVWVVLGQSCAIIGALVGVRLLTNVLSPEVYGELALGVTVAALANQIVTGPLNNAFMRFYSPAFEVGQLRSFFLGMKKWLTISSLFLVAAFSTIASTLFAVGYVKWFSIIFAALCLAIISGFNSALNCIQNAARQRAIVALHQGVGQILKFLLAVALVGILGMFSSVAILGYALAALAILLSQYFFFRRNILPLSQSERAPAPDDANEWSRRMVAYAWPFATWGLFTWAQMASDRWSLQIFSTTRDVGLYAVLFQIGYYPMIMSSGLLSQLVAPILFSKAGDATDPGRMCHISRLNNRMVFLTFLLSVIATFFALFFHQQIFSLLVAPEFRNISFLLPVMILAGGLFATGQVATQILTVDVNTWVLIKPKVTTAIIGIILNLSGSYYYGLQGVVVSFLVFSSIYLGWILWLTRSSYYGYFTSQKTLAGNKIF